MRRVDISWNPIARASTGDCEARSTFGAIYLPIIRRFLGARWHTTPLAEDLEDAAPSPR